MRQSSLTRIVLFSCSTSSWSLKLRFLSLTFQWQLSWPGQCVGQFQLYRSCEIHYTKWHWMPYFKLIEKVEFLTLVISPPRTMEALVKTTAAQKFIVETIWKKTMWQFSLSPRPRDVFWMPKMPLFPTRSIQSVLTWNFVPLSTSTHAGEAVWPIMRSIDLIRFTFRSLFRPAGCEPCLAVWGRVDVVACQQFIGIGKGINFPIGGSIFLIYFFGLTEKDFCWLIGLVKRFKRLVIPTSPCNVYDGGILIRQNKFISELTDPHWHFGHWFSYLFSVSHWLFE